MIELLTALYTGIYWWLLPIFQVFWFCVICVQLWVMYRTRKIEHEYRELAQRYVGMLAELESERAALLRAMQHHMQLHTLVKEYTNGRPVQPER